MSQALIATCVGGRRAGYVQAAPPPSSVPSLMERWGFTVRQVECIEAVITHGTAKKAAASLGLSPKTVETHIGHAYEKVGVFHISQLVAAYVTAQLTAGGFE